MEEKIETALANKTVFTKEKQDELVREIEKLVLKNMKKEIELESSEIERNLLNLISKNPLIEFLKLTNISGLETIEVAKALVSLRRKNKVTRNGPENALQSISRISLI